MNVILLQKVANLGNLGDQVNVAPGYARNFLIPTGKAKSATVANIAEFEARRVELEKQAQQELATAQAKVEKLGSLLVTISAKAGDEGKLYGSIGSRDVADAVTAAGVAVAKHEIRMTSPLRAVGEYEINLHLHHDVNCTVKVNIVTL